MRCLDFSIPIINIRWNLNILHIYLRMNIRKFWQGNLAIFQMKKCLILYSIFWHFEYIIPPMIFQELSKTVLNFSCSIRAILEGRHPIYPLLLPQRKLSKIRPIELWLEWLFTHKQRAWGPPPLNQSWKINLWPLQTKIFKINAKFIIKLLEKPEIITRTPSESRPSD